MTTDASRSTFMPAQTPFDCPVCGAHVDEVTLTINADIIYSRPTAELWPGGPVVEDITQPLLHHVVDQIVGTNACQHTFRMSLWDFALIARPDGSGEIELTKRYP
jgi:hypothetical protein